MQAALQKQQEEYERINAYRRNKPSADELRAMTRNAVHMPAKQLDSIAKHRLRMHPKTQEEAEKKKSGKGGRMHVKF